LFTVSISQLATFSLSLDEEYSPDEPQASLAPLVPGEAQALLVPLALDEAQALLAPLALDEAQALLAPLAPDEARCSQVLKPLCSLLEERLREFQPYKVLPPAWPPLPHDR
jgi:hypothetical protein